MRVTLDKLSALRVLRALRAAGKSPALLGRCELLAPRPPEPFTRWKAKTLPLRRLGLQRPPSKEEPLQIVVASQQQRVRAGFLKCSALASQLPKGSFIQVDDGVCLPCPELLYVRLATQMSFHSLCLLGFELCGAYTRDEAGRVVSGVSQATSPEKIAAFAHSCPHLSGSHLALKAVKHVRENAWSAMEALVALLLSLPARQLGYGLGEVVLNKRFHASEGLVARGCRASRVPDILVEGSRVGFNYDGRVHLDLENVARAAAEGNRDEAILAARHKYVDDLRRNRELAAMGLVVLPVTLEDLRTPGGLDTVVLEALECERNFGMEDRPDVRSAALDYDLSIARHDLIRSLMSE